MKTKFSRQREAIRKKLHGRYDHPTAETLYLELKEEFPSLSVATVYRNLNRMVERGEIARISLNGPARFDHNPEPHSHFFCKACGCVLDMPDNNTEMLITVQKEFEGRIESCSSQFYGICSNCMKEKSQ
ncbi:MAG TPA: transcriptional repressor [Mogibacterium sp.]|nr:transcriptional repressor [Mogibacterium sp.]